MSSRLQPQEEAPTAGYGEAGYATQDYYVGEKLESAGEVGMIVGALIFVLGFASWVIGRRMKRKALGQGTGTK